MKTIYIVIIIVLLGASVFAYIYNQKTQSASTPAASSVPAQQGVQPAGNATAANGLNPEHGLPGHRCDLPVGAPLTVSKEQKSAAPAKPKTNPQHGMPGHRCDLAVGAPL